MEEKIKVVSVIGAGFMGDQIIRKAALKDYTVRFSDVKKEGCEQLARSLTRSKKRKNLKGEVTFHDTIAEAVKDADLIIEAVPEKLELKRKVFAELDKQSPSHTIITTNSSSIPVSKLEDVVKSRDKLLNLHFYHLTLWPMADIMRGTQTSDETFEIGKAWLKSIDIEPLVVKKECYGFVFNRVWRSVKKECLKIWAGGYADAEEVDKAWKIFTGMGRGPFAIMDGIGLDVVYDIEISYYKKSGLPDDKPPDRLKEMVDKGELGLKTKKGFYNYGS